MHNFTEHSGALCEFRGLVSLHLDETCDSTVILIQEVQVHWKDDHKLLLAVGLPYLAFLFVRQCGELIREWIQLNTILEKMAHFQLDMSLFWDIAWLQGH